MANSEKFSVVLLSTTRKQNAFKNSSFEEINPTILCQKIFTNEYPFDGNNILLIINDSFPVVTAYDIFMALGKYKNKSNKKVICYASTIDISNILIMSICDLRFAPPLQGPIYLGIYNIHFKINDNLLKHINFDVLGEYGKYKLGPSYFIRNQSDEVLEMYDDNVLKKMNNQIFDLINITFGKNIFTKSWIDSTEKLKEEGFLENILYLEQLYLTINVKNRNLIGNLFGVVLKKMKYIFSNRENKVCIVEFTQNLSDKFLNRKNVFLSILKKINKVNPKKVIFILDSKGGDFSQAHQQAFLLTKYLDSSDIYVYAKKALSSGYFFICDANKIIVNKFSRLGNIGNYSISLNITSLINNLGLELIFKPDDFVLNKEYFNIGNQSAFLKEMEKKNVRCNNMFWDKLIQNRNLSEIEKIKQGLIFLGKDCVSVGLADEEFSLIELLEKLDKKKIYQYVYISKSQKLINQLFILLKSYFLPTSKNPINL